MKMNNENGSCKREREEENKDDTHARKRVRSDTGTIAKVHNYIWGNRAKLEGKLIFWPSTRYLL